MGGRQAHPSLYLGSCSLAPSSQGVSLVLGALTHRRHAVLVLTVCRTQRGPPGHRACGY